MTDEVTTSPASEVCELVDKWFAETMPNSPASASVACWNHLMAAKEDLKQRLTKEIA